MPNKHKTPMLGWHPPAELSEWVKAEAKRRGVPYRVLLDEALSDLRTKLTEQGHKQARGHMGENRAGDR